MMRRWSTLAGCGPAEGRRAAGGAGESESRGHLDEAKAAELSAGAAGDIMISWDWKWDDLANKSWGIHWIYTLVAYRIVDDMGNSGA